jgi:ATP-GRASP peptide maturase of grasp-with-spasm system
MLLILSDEDDLSTNQVIDWLRYYAIPWHRLSSASELQLQHLEIKEDGIHFTLKVSEPQRKAPDAYIHSSAITAYWYRRGSITLAQNTINPAPSEESVIARIISNICRHIKQENTKIPQLLHLWFKTLKHLGSYFENDTNKLYNLFLASHLGLSVPGTLVTNSKVRFMDFQKKSGLCVVKALDRAGFQAGSSIGIGNTTCVVDESALKEMPDSFGYTLFQQFIDKAYDLRVFYLDGKFYSSAILSQSNEQTKIDFRNYDPVQPNRIVPYQLPAILEIKLHSLMQILGLKSGSIDLVRGRAEDYYFLEINPIGQYAFSGTRCNYHLDKHIAHYFSAKNTSHARSN